MSNTNDRFQLAIKKISESNVDLSNDQKLDLYKYFKQGTIGNCNGEEPYFFELKAHAKWKAWSSVKGMNKEQALLNYINLVNIIVE